MIDQIVSSVDVVFFYRHMSLDMVCAYFETPEQNEFVSIVFIRSKYIPRINNNIEKNNILSQPKYRIV